jgi:hypothetical protein
MIMRITTMRCTIHHNTIIQLAVLRPPLRRLAVHITR